MTAVADARTLAGAELEVRDLTLATPALDHVSLRARPGQLVAIVGASGVGKSTLLETLAGMRRPDSGTIRGADGPLGYVPQEDIVHRELKLRRMLRYAAQLRVPGNEAQALADDTLAALGLSGRAELRVGSLSGGERKRASIAVELLTRPSVLLLDEPTSGLDPAGAADVMALLRALADAGATVVMTTHVMRDLAAADHVVVLERGGRVAFAGAPAEVRRHFQPEFWEEAGPPATARIALRPAPAPRPPGTARQTLVLARRTLEVLTGSRLTLAIVLGSPLMVVAMFLVLFGAGALEASPSAAIMIPFWIAFDAFFFGLTYGLLQIVAELPILRRERVAGVRIGPYLGAKLAALVPVLIAVDLVMLAALVGLDRLPSEHFGELLVTTVLASVAALALGLLASSGVRDAAQATVAMPLLCFPQVLFSGAIVPLPTTPPAGRVIGLFMGTRWAFEGLGHAAGITAPAEYGNSFGRALWIDWTILAVFTLAAMCGAAAVLARRARGPAR